MTLPSPVLFVCARNAVRSPMAEALWRREFPGSHVLSCGLDPAAYPDGFMIAAMDEAGYDLSEFEPRDLGALGHKDFELVICLASEAEREARALAQAHQAEFWSWDIPDPSLATGSRQDRLGAYQDVRDRLADLIKDLHSESA